MRQHQHARIGHQFHLDNVLTTHAIAAQSSLFSGDIVRVVSAGSTGTALHFYGRNLTSVRWHHKPSVAPDLDHGSVTGSSLMLLQASDIHAVSINELRAAVMATTIFDALDVTGVALETIAALSRGEVRHG